MVTRKVKDFAGLGVDLLGPLATRAERDRLANATEFPPQ
jgi:hypothetical protein